MRYRNRKLYTSEAIEGLMEDYYRLGGSYITVAKGSLGHGTVVFYNYGNKDLVNLVVKEIYLNEWSSAHTIRRYRVLPKKYKDMLLELGVEV